MIGLDYRLELSRHEPETSWFRRVVLRHRTRRVLIASQVPTDFTFTRTLGKPDSQLAVTVVGEDAMALLERYEARP